MTQPFTSPYAQVGGLYWFARMLDKIRQAARGELPAQKVPFLGKGMDDRLCRFLRVDYTALHARVVAGADDQAVLAWCQANGRAIDENDVLIWNQFVSKRGWRDETTAALEADKAKSGLVHRTDIVTFFDFYEVDEGRAGPPGPPR